MKKVVLSILFIMIFAPTRAQTFEQKIQEMIELSGATQNFDVVVNRMIQLQKSQFNEISDEFWKRFEQALQDSAKTNMINSIIPIYAKHLSERDVDGIIAFYKSEAGKHLVENLPNIMTESMTVGQDLGMELAQMIGEAIDKDKLDQFNTDYEGCEIAKEGNFSFNFNGQEIKYIRSKNKQIEKYGNIQSKFSIEWLSDSRYKLELLSSNDPNQEKKNSKPLVINIISCDDNGYKYLAKLEDDDLIREGQLYKE